MQVIIYPHMHEGVQIAAILTPVLECGLTIEEIAAQDVPAGVPWKIIDSSELPQDPLFRNAWQYQE